MTTSHKRAASVIKASVYCGIGVYFKNRVTNASASTDLRGLVHLELSLGPLLLQLLLQSPTLCPPLPQSLLSSGLQLISALLALLEQCLLLLPLILLFALKEKRRLNFTVAWVNCCEAGRQHGPSTLPAFAAAAPSMPGPRTVAATQKAQS